MFSNKDRKLYFFICLSLLILTTVFYFGSKYLFSYSDTKTHPKITEKAIEIYNSQFGGRITDQQKEWIIKGSINEDIFPRYLNHFYDPAAL